MLGLGFIIQFMGCGGGMTHEGNLIFTKVPAEVVNLKSIENADFRYAAGLKLAMITRNEPKSEIEFLSEDFYSARAPEIAYDGLRMLFSGQKNEGDVWQIWMLDFKTGETSQVTTCENNCTDPIWLPDGRVVFSKYIDENGLKHHALFTIAMDGCCEQRISFQPHEDLNASILHDGRILFSSQQLYPEPGHVKYLVMRPDGTKAELFYLSGSNDAMSQAAETNEHVLFAQAGQLRSVKFSRPLHSSKSFDDLKDILIQSVFPLDNTHMLVSVQRHAQNSVAIAILDLENNQLEDFYIGEAGYHAIEPVIVKNRILPRKLPSRVNTEKETGYFVCMDASKSEMIPQNEGVKTAKVQVLGLEHMLGETDVAEDGSFYLEIKADQPVRFQTLDNSGMIVHGPSSWMWVRPNERRGCVGCHTDHEMAPENVVPKAIEKMPVAMIK